MKNSNNLSLFNDIINKELFTEIFINDMVRLRDDNETDLRVVIVNGQALLQYQKSNRIDEHFAMGTLANTGVARISEIAAGFGRHRNVVRYDRDKLAKGGIEAIVGPGRGSKGPTKVKTQVHKRIVELKAAGATNVSIATRFGITEGAVRAALKRNGVEDAGLSNTQEALVLKSAGKTESSPQSEVVSAEVTGDEIRPIAEATEPRSIERLLAYFGKLEEARSEFSGGSNLRFMGAFLALSVLDSMPVWENFKAVYGKLRNGFYGLQSLVVTLFLMSILRIKHVENLKGVPPEVLGRLLGLDRAPEVKTVRRKLNEIALFGQSHELIRSLGASFAAQEEEALGFLYIDGHVRAYHGKRKISKDYVSSRRLSMPASTDYWVNNSAGDPLFVVTALLNQRLTKAMPDLLKEVRGLLGERRATIVFDRGGWSAPLFKRIKKMGFDFMTYRKGKYRKYSSNSFSPYEINQGDNKKEKWLLADGRIRLKGLGLTRCVARLRKNNRQTHIVTSRDDMNIGEVAVRMFDRWRQENFFKYMKAEFAIDALVSYEFEAVDEERLIVNPQVKVIDKKRKVLNKELAGLEKSYGANALNNQEKQCSSMRGFKISNTKLGKAIAAVKEKLKKLTSRRKLLPKEISLKEAMGKQKLVALEVERRRFVDAIKIAAYRAETSLLHLLQPYYKRNDDEGRALLKEIFKSSGDIEIGNGELRIKLEPLSSPHRTKALELLSSKLNSMNYCYPGQKLVLKFGVRQLQNALK